MMKHMDVILSRHEMEWSSAYHLLLHEPAQQHSCLHFCLVHPQHLPFLMAETCNKGLKTSHAQEKYIES